MVSSQARRDQVALAMERGYSQRQACELIELPRSILHYRAELLLGPHRLGLCQIKS